MSKQPAFPGLRDATKKKVTRREQFLAEMDTVVPWERLFWRIGWHYPKAGQPPMPLETMLQVHLFQNWYALSDPMAEEKLNDSDAMRHFIDDSVLLVARLHAAVTAIGRHHRIRIGGGGNFLNLPVFSELRLRGLLAPSHWPRCSWT